MFPFLRRPGPRARRAAPAVRAFDPADVPRLVDLWTRAYAGYAGLVVQTPDAWRWRVLARPGVGPEDVLVAADAAGTPVGYGVVDATGTVLEVAVDPAAAPGARAAAANQLVDALEARCRARGQESIRFVLPDADEVVQRALRGAGYWTEPMASFTATIADVAALLEAVLPPRLGALPPGWSPTFRLVVERGADWPYPRLVTRVTPGPPLVVAAEPPDAPVEGAVDCTITLSLETLNGLFFGKQTADVALAAGAVAVQPASRARDAATFLRLVTVGAPWYNALADGR